MMHPAVSLNNIPLCCESQSGHSQARDSVPYHFVSFRHNPYPPHNGKTASIRFMRAQSAALIYVNQICPISPFSQATPWHRNDIELLMTAKLNINTFIFIV